MHSYSHCLSLCGCSSSAAMSQGFVKMAWMYECEPGKPPVSKRWLIAVAWGSFRKKPETLKCCTFRLEAGEVLCPLALVACRGLSSLKHRTDGNWRLPPGADSLWGG